MLNELDFRILNCITWAKTNPPPNLSCKFFTPLLARIILASTKENDWILDPFTGASTSGIAASLLSRNFLGIDKEVDFLEISKKRREEIDDVETRLEYQKRIIKYSDRKV